MPGNQNINLERVGGTKQSAANVIDSANSAVRVNVVAGTAPLAAMVRSLPLLNYSAIPISDGSGGLWALTENDDGTLTITATSGTAVPLILNDLTSLTSYQITVNSGQLQATAVTFSLAYPSATGFITAGGLKSALFIANGQLSTLHPTSAPDWNVSIKSSVLPSNAAQEASGNLSTIASQTRNDPQIADTLTSILAQLRLLNYNLLSNMNAGYVDPDGILMDTFTGIN